MNNPLLSPLITPPDDWQIPANIQVRRVVNIGGIRCLVFSDPAVVAAGVSRGWVGTVEDLFKPKDLPAIFAAINSPKR